MKVTNKYYMDNDVIERLPNALQYTYAWKYPQQKMLEQINFTFFTIVTCLSRFKIRYLMVSLWGLKSRATHSLGTTPKQRMSTKLSFGTTFTSLNAFNCDIFLKNIQTYIHTNMILSTFSIHCMTQASRLRHSAPVWNIKFIDSLAKKNWWMRL